MESSLNLRESKESSPTLRELSKSPKAHGPHSEEEEDEMRRRRLIELIGGVRGSGRDTT